MEPPESDDLLRAELSANLSLFLNVSLDVDEGPVVASTPKRAVGRRSSRQSQAQSSNTSPFKRPAPRQLGPPLAKCNKCGAEYRTLRYYQRHMQAHKLKELASRVPDMDAIYGESQALGLKVLEIIMSKPDVYGPMGTKFRHLLHEVKTNISSDEWTEVMTFLCQKFYGLLSADKFCMPSALLTSALKVADEILTSFEDRKFVSVRVKILVKCEDNVNDSFVCEFVLTLADQLVIFIMRCLRNAHQTLQVQNKEIVIDQHQRQVIFYIGGSIVHKMRKYGEKYTSNKKWKKIVEVIDCKILEDDFWETLSVQQKSDRLWTEQRSRGGLKYVKEKFQVFLVSVAKVIIKHKQPDGSLPVEEILSELVASEPRLEWDSAIGNALDQDSSLNLMVGVAKSLISSYGRGIILRFLNCVNNNAASISIPLRHKVAVS